MGKLNCCFWLPQEEPDQYTLKEGNVLKAESVLRQLAPPDEWYLAHCLAYTAADDVRSRSYSPQEPARPSA